MGEGRSVVVTGAGAGIGRGILERLIGRWLGGRGRGAGRRAWRRTPGRASTPTAAAASSWATRPIGTSSRRRARPRGASRRWVAGSTTRRWSATDSVHQPGARAGAAAVPAQRRGLLLGLLGGCPVFPGPADRGLDRQHLVAPRRRRRSPSWAAYEMSKGAVNALTRNLAVEYGPVGIRANSVAPGAIWTPWNAGHGGAVGGSGRGSRPAGGVRDPRAGWASRRRSPRPSRSCCPTRRRSSPAQCCPWTAERPRAPTP